MHLALHVGAQVVAHTYWRPEELDLAHNFVGRGTISQLMCGEECAGLLVQHGFYCCGRCVTVLGITLCRTLALQEACALCAACGSFSGLMQSGAAGRSRSSIRQHGTLLLQTCFAVPSVTSFQAPKEEGAARLAASAH